MSTIINSSLSFVVSKHVLLAYSVTLDIKCVRYKVPQGVWLSLIMNLSDLAEVEELDKFKS